MGDIDLQPQPKKADLIKCSICQKRDFDRKTLVIHWRKDHGIEPSFRKPNLKCSFSEECTFSCASSELLRNHLKLAHNINIEKKFLTFKTKEEFNKWRADEEAVTSARYVAYTGTKCKSTGKVFYLRCHRSGAVRPDTGERKRANPDQGNAQCAAICPSTIRVSEMADGSLHVLYYPDHLGHNLEDDSLKYMKLNEAERLEILAKLGKGEPVGKIVTDARKVKGNRLSKLNFLQRRDVYNLKKKGVYLEKDDEQDGKMIHAWVKGLNLKSEDKSPIVLYNPINKYKDYALIIIHDVQKAAFEHSFDGSIVYVKIKKGKPNVDFILTAVSIVTKEGESFPIAFCMSQKAEYISLYTLYHTMHRIYGLIKPKFFVSDNLTQSYVAWTNVMGDCERRLACVFDLESNWGQKLAQYKVPVPQQRIAADQLKSLMNELNQKKFMEEMDKTMTEWWDEETMKTFTCFFQRQYVRQCTEWAGCFRIYDNPNQTIDGYLEPINAILDTIYVESYMGLNNALNYLMTHIRDSCLLKLIKWDINIRQEKIQETERRHKEGAEIRGVRTNGSEWFYNENEFDYIVKKVINDCNRDCGIFCSDCDVCVHQYSCYCKDYVVGFNLCKHIHAARMAMARAEEAKEIEKVIEFEKIVSPEEKETESGNEKEGEGTREKEMESTKEKEAESTKENEADSTKEKEADSTDKKEAGSTKEKKDKIEKGEKRKRDEPVEKQRKRARKDLPMTASKRSALATAKSLLTDLEKSKLKATEYKKVWKLDLDLVSEFETPGGILSMAASDNMLYTCSTDQSIQSWDLNAMKNAGKVSTFLFQPQKLYVDKATKLLWAGDSQGNVAKFEGGEECGKFELVEEIWDLMVTSAPNLVYTARDRDVVVSELITNNGRPRVMIKGTFQGRSPFCIAGNNFCFMDRDGRNIIVHENNVDQKFPRLKEIAASELIVNALTPATGDIVYSGGYDSAVKKWDLKSSNCLGSVNLGCCINALSCLSENEVYVAKSDGIVSKVGL